MSAGAALGGPPRPAHPLLIGITGILLAALAVLAGYLVYAVWPRTASNGDIEANITLFWELKFDVSVEARYLLLVMASGILGSFVHAATSFADFVGNRRIQRSWLWWYALRPFIGFSLALIFYVAIRAGFFSTDADAEDLNVYGVAAIGAMTGMFSKQATDKLREMFDTLFRTAGDERRSDSLGDDERPGVTEVNPAYGPGDVPVVIRGHGFFEGTIVKFGDVLMDEIERVSDAEIRGRVPLGVGVVDVTVTNPNGSSFVKGRGFEYVQRLETTPGGEPGTT